MARDDCLKIRAIPGSGFVERSYATQSSIEHRVSQHELMEIRAARVRAGLLERAKFKIVGTNTAWSR
jgi:hypothetical protein